MSLTRIGSKYTGGWLSFYSGARNVELTTYPGTVTGVAGWELFQSRIPPSPELGYGSSEDFAPSKLYDTTTYPGFTVTDASGTLVMADAAGGVLQLTPLNKEDKGIQMQSDGEIILPAATKDFWFECRVKGNDVTEVDWFIGLATTDTSLIASVPNSLIAFRTDDGDANINFQVRSGGTGDAADTGVDLTDGAWTRLGFFINGVTSVTPYVDGVAKTAVTANIPATEMALSFAVLTGENAANTLDIDWYKLEQLR